MSSGKNSSLEPNFKCSINIILTSPIISLRCLDYSSTLQSGWGAHPLNYFRTLCTSLSHNFSLCTQILHLRVYVFYWAVRPFRKKTMHFTSISPGMCLGHSRHWKYHLVKVEIIVVKFVLNITTHSCTYWICFLCAWPSSIVWYQMDSVLK